MRLDLGGIAKGPAADAMLAAFKKHGLPRTGLGLSEPRTATTAAESDARATAACVD